MAPVTRGKRTKRGFTLLEVLLAVAVIASVAMLGSTLWVQASESSALVQSRERGLRLQRVGSLLRDQWSDRRALELPGESEAERAMGGVRFGAGSISFCTTRTILLPEAPLVAVEYLLREREDGLVDLLYAERLVVRFSGPAEESETASGDDASLRRAATVLLEGCDAITLERFGAPAEIESGEEEEGASQTRPRPSWMPFEPEGDEQEIESEAVRVSVRYQGEEALWVLVARPSR